MIADLLDWLVEQGLVRAPETVDAKERALTTGADLPKAERLASLLYDLAERVNSRGAFAVADDYIEDYLTITRVDPGVRGSATSDRSMSVRPPAGSRARAGR